MVDGVFPVWAWLDGEPAKAGCLCMLIIKADGADCLAIDPACPVHVREAAVINHHPDVRDDDGRRLPW